MSELINAMTELNPDQVLLNLFRLDSELESTANASDLSACEVLLGELTCADDSGQEQNITSVIANLNKFLDSDRDGTVNSLDTDDDNDGILDTEDTRPYSERSLVPRWLSSSFRIPTLRTDCLNGLEFNQRLP